jgi:phage portal protein BeeE/phage FluMu protein Com
MGIREQIRSLVYGPPVKKTWSREFVEKRLTANPDSLIGTLERLQGTRAGRVVWRRVSVREALGVPAIHRSVAIISSTTGMLSIQAYRNGVLMSEPPSLVARPDPFETPGAFYGGTAADHAKYGEFCWWIASLDSDGKAASLVRVPLYELTVEENLDNRLRPTYRWGSKTGTRYSGANPEGRFVHVKYPLSEPFALRGEGPLQLCGVANSVAVESQNWAGNFYGEGGYPSVLIKKAGIISPTKLDPTDWLPMDPADPDYETTGRSEADLLRDQVVGRPNNTAMVIDDSISSVEYKQPNEAEAQMLDARQFNNGDAAREFGIPGPLLEFQQPGGSLTYQNRTELKGQLLEMCLMPLYLEPIEQAMSDLLSRSTVARFNVKGFLRADIKTRYDVHSIAITSGIYDPAYARKEEGIEPGDVEYAPIGFSPPAAIPSAIPRFASLREPRCPSCNKLVAKTLGPGSEVECPRCKTLVRGPEAEERATVNETHIHLPEGMVQVATPVTVHNPDVLVKVEPQSIDLHAATSPEETAATEDMVETLRQIKAEMAKPRVVDKQVIRDADGRLVGVREIEVAEEVA